MILNLMKNDIDSMSCSTLVVFSKAFKSEGKSLTKITHSELGKKLQQSIEEKVITGKHLEAVLFREFNYKKFRHVLVVGLGKENDLSHEIVRQSMAQVYECLRSSKINEAAVDFEGVGGGKAHGDAFLKATSEGMTLSSYTFEELKSADKPAGTNKDSKNITVHIVTKKQVSKTASEAFNEGIFISESVNFSRRLGDMPGNLMTPSLLADNAIKAAKGTGMRVTVWDKVRIKKEKMDGLLGVSLGSSEDPRFIIMEYKGAGASKKPVVFVGKGLTFDSGGISIKPSAAMEEMKYDMCGGANVIGAMQAIARLKLKVNVVGLIPATENMPGPAANKPGDIMRARNGKSFEVNNTDAEGRLILSDALSYASELNPEVIFDIATLTGAMVIALGNTHTGFFTRNKELKKNVESAAVNSGELVWNMPLCDSHVKDMKGTFADLSNISSSKGAGSSTAAAFLEQFVEPGIPWAHFDIAGTGWAVGGRLNYCTKKGASGVMIRTFVELAKGYV